MPTQSLPGPMAADYNREGGPSCPPLACGVQLCIVRPHSLEKSPCLHEVSGTL